MEQNANRNIHAVLLEVAFTMFTIQNSRKLPFKYNISKFVCLISGVEQKGDALWNYSTKICIRIILCRTHC